MNFELMNRAVSILDNDNVIEFISPGKSDFFIDTSSNYKKANAPFYNTTAEGDFILRSKVKPEFKNIYDAGCLFIYQSENRWIKFAFENTDLGYPSMVSVVTNGVSDDCNGEKIDEPEIWMQIVRKGNNWCLHYSKDKTIWKMVRYFRFELDKSIKIGISAQSPLGEGCKVLFENLEVLKNNYKNIREAK